MRRPLAAAIWWRSHVPGAEREGRLLASLEPDESREHRPRRAARGQHARRAFLAPASGPGLDEAPSLRDARALRAARGGGPDPSRRRAVDPGSALRGAGGAWAYAPG